MPFPLNLATCEPLLSLKVPSLPMPPILEPLAFSTEPLGWMSPMGDPVLSYTMPLALKDPNFQLEPVTVPFDDTLPTRWFALLYTSPLAAILPMTFPVGEVMLPAVIFIMLALKLAAAASSRFF